MFPSSANYIHIFVVVFVKSGNGSRIAHPEVEYVGFVVEGGGGPGDVVVDVAAQRLELVEVAVLLLDIRHEVVLLFLFQLLHELSKKLFLLQRLDEVTVSDAVAVAVGCHVDCHLRLSKFREQVRKGPVGDIPVGEAVAEEDGDVGADVVSVKSERRRALDGLDGCWHPQLLAFVEQGQ